MNRVLIVILILVVALVAQTTPSQITLTPLGLSSGCVASTTGAVLCAASDGFYVSIAGGTFQKIVVGTVSVPATITCTTASLSTGTSGSFTASGCH